MGFPGGLDSKVSAYNVRDLGAIPGSGGSPGEGKGNPIRTLCVRRVEGGVAGAY